MYRNTDEHQVDMETNDSSNIKVQVSFPKSSEDHRLQLVEIKGSIFAIVFSPLESQGPIHLSCSEWSLIFLAPIKSKTHIVISAINVICLSEIISEEGSVTIHASNRLVKFANLIKSTEKFNEIGEQGEFELTDDPGTMIYYYRLYDSLISSMRTHNPELIIDAQQKFIASLCTLADKMEGKSDNLTLHKVLSVWNIASLNS